MADIHKLRSKFFADPDWVQMEEIIENYIAPLESCLNIDITLSNDQIATEVRGRQLSVKSMRNFLAETGMLKARPITKNNFE